MSSLGIVFVILLFIGVAIFRIDEGSGGDWAEYPEVEMATAVILAPQTLTVTLELSAKPEDLTATTEGEPCAGAGRFDDLGPDTAIAIYDVDENLLVTATQTSSILTRSGSIFSDCTMTYVIEYIPTLTDYIFEIPGRSLMTLSFDELEAEGWSLNLKFGP